MPNQKIKTDKINRDLFKDMPSALRDETDIKIQKGLDRIKGVAIAFGVAAAAVIGTALFMDKDKPEDVPHDTQRTEIKIDHTPE